VLLNSSCALFTDAQITDVHGDPDVTHVTVEVAGTASELPCDRLVAALGFTANLGPLLEWGLDIKQRRHIVVNTKCETTVPGVYAAGDIAEYDGKLRLIATGFGEVATAVNNAASFLDPSVKAFPGHLSDYAPAPGQGAAGSPTA
jgi:thioredoxin reductase (NADPH)